MHLWGPPGRLGTVAVVPDTHFTRTVDGVYLAYQVVDGGPLDLMLAIPGGYPIDLIWDEPVISAFMGRLSSFSRVITFDPRGFGSSERVDPDRLPPLQAWGDDIGTVMDAVGVDQASIFSWAEGTPGAMLFAATYPHRVRSLVLVNGFARFVRSDDCPWGLPAHLVAAYAESIRRAWGTGGVLATTAPSMVRNDDARRRWARAERLSASPNWAAVGPRATYESNLVDILPSIQAPTLVVSRRGDPHVRHEHSRFLATRIPAAKLVELDGNDDVPFSGDAEQLLDEVQEFLTGTRPAPLLDRVLATVLFTDIVGSTQRVSSLGDNRWRTLLDEYDELVMRQLDRFRGRRVKGTGDGTLATFDGPARAVECARAITDSVGNMGVEIRAGLHTGEIESRGDDVAGIAVHVAARVSELARAGEILVTRTVTDLVAGSGIQFEDRGERELRGVPGSWRLFTVSA